jgi:hypothetical protein
MKLKIEKSIDVNILNDKSKLYVMVFESLLELDEKISDFKLPIEISFTIEAVKK